MKTSPVIITKKSFSPTIILSSSNQKLANKHSIHATTQISVKLIAYHAHSGQASGIKSSSQVSGTLRPFSGFPNIAAKRKWLSAEIRQNLETSADTKQPKTPGYKSPPLKFMVPMNEDPLGQICNPTKKNAPWKSHLFVLHNQKMLRKATLYYISTIPEL